MAPKFFRVRQVYKSRALYEHMKKERAEAQLPKSSVSASSHNNSSGTTSVTLGIVGIVLSLLSPFLGIVLSIPGLIFGLVQRQSFASKWSSSGIILNILALLLSILGIILVFMFPELVGGLE